jgi:hypothetical protein
VLSPSMFSRAVKRQAARGANEDSDEEPSLHGDDGVLHMFKAPQDANTSLTRGGKNWKPRYVRPAAPVLMVHDRTPVAETKPKTGVSFATEAVERKGDDEDDDDGEDDNVQRELVDGKVDDDDDDDEKTPFIEDCCLPFGIGLILRYRRQRKEKKKAEAAAKLKAEADAAAAALAAERSRQDAARSASPLQRIMSMRSAGGEEDGDDVHGPPGVTTTFKQVYDHNRSFRVPLPADGKQRSKQQSRLWAQAQSSVMNIVQQVGYCACACDGVTHCPCHRLGVFQLSVVALLRC